MTTTDFSEREILKQRNIAAWDGQYTLDVATSLDSSLKKNTAFIKKARLGLNAENLISLVSDVKCLSLEKYLSEVVSAVAEGLSKVSTKSDLAAAIEVVSLLHQRFAAQFTTVLSYHLVRGLAPPPTSYLASLSLEQREKDESSRINRQRNLIRVVTELWLLKVVRSIQDALEGAGPDIKKRKMDDAMPVFCLRELLSNDHDFANLSIMTAFVKSFPLLTSLTKHTGESDHDEDIQKISTILSRYYDQFVSHLRTQARRLDREKSRIEESTIAHGSASSAREATITELQKHHDKQVAAAQIIQEVLGKEPLVLEESGIAEASEASIIRGIGSLRKDGDLLDHESKWEDEEQRRFYEALLDLSQVVPSDMLHEDKVPGSVPDTSNIDGQDTEPEPVYDDTEIEPVEVVEEVVEPPTTTIGVKVQNLLLRLPELTNKELIDSAAVEFSFLNSKASRNRLIKALLDVSLSRADLLPYYARLIATLGQHLTSIPTEIIDSIHRDCRRFTFGKGLNKDITKRTLNIRYLSELIKFGIVPSHVIFHCLKIMIDGFSKPDVEVLAVMLEHCGKYLLRTDVTAQKMDNVLAVIMRKAQNTSGVERTLIENAFYYVNPPDRAGIEQPERSTHELYIDKLMYKDLTPKNHDHVLRLLKKMNWQDVDVHAYLRNIFTKAWTFNYSAVSLLAVVLSGLSKFHNNFIIAIVDSVVENIRSGLEENIFRENQKRIATIKYLGELYKCKIVDSSVIFNTLYLLLSFGTPEGRPIVGGTAADPGQDFFRVRLILTLIDTCGSSFSHGHLRGKMDLYLCLFQFYLRTKIDLPMDVEYDVMRSLRIIRPALQLCKTLEEAASELDQAIRNTVDVAVDHAGSDDDTTSTDSPTAVADVDDENTNGHTLGSRSSSTSSDDEVVEEEEQEFVLLEKKREQDDLDRSAEEDLEREFSKMMSESLDTRKAEVRKPLDIALPRRQVSQANGDSVRENSADRATANKDKNPLLTSNEQVAVKFTFLSRKSRPRQLDMPSDSPLALNNAANRIAEEKEKQTIRDLTLRYEGAQNREDLEEGLAKAGINVKYVPTMLAGHKGGTRSGSIFKMGARPENKDK